MSSKPAQPQSVELTEPLSGPLPRLSLVVPTYNVETYLAAFLESVFAQTSRTQRFEVLIVDDGSTDASCRIALDWAARYPAHIRCIQQENHGLSAARNTGLRAARGKWVSFPDPDDVLDPDYFRVILEQTVVPHEKPLLMIVAKLLPFDEATGLSHDNHPLDYRFRRGLRYVDTSDMGDFIHLSAASCWFDRNTLLRLKLFFNRRVRPVFEDGHLIAKLMMLSPDRTIAVVPKAIYNYQKRADASSLVMSAKTQKAFYLDAIEYGCLDLILFALKNLEYVPEFVQRTCLYEIQSRIKYLMGDDLRISILTEAEQEKFFSLLQKIFKHIDVETIQSLHVPRFEHKHRIALIARFKPEEVITDILYVEAFDPVTGMARFSYFTGADEGKEVRLMTQEGPLPLFDRSSIWTSLAGKQFLGQHWFHARLPREGEIACEAHDVRLVVRHVRRNMQEPLSHAGLSAFLRPRQPEHLDADTVALRDALIARKEPSIYAGAWLLMGAPMQASEDAVHLFEHLAGTDQAHRTWFVLSILSPDWARLMAAGFRLLPYGSAAHNEALVDAELLVTSCPDTDEYWPTGQSALADLTRIRTVLLAQEVPPERKADYLCVASQEESDARTALDASPRWFAPEIRITGFARHDTRSHVTPVPGSVAIVADWVLGSNDHLLPDLSSKKASVEAHRKYWKGFFDTLVSAQAGESDGPAPSVLVGRDLARKPEIRAIAGHLETVEPGENAHRVPAMIASASLVVTDRVDLAFDTACFNRQAILCNRDHDSPPLPHVLTTHTPEETIDAIEAYRTAGGGTADASSDNRVVQDACALILTALEKLTADDANDDAA